MMPEFRGHSMAEYRQREAERIALQPLLTRCALCAWSYEGTTGDARQKAAEHRQQAHPDLPPQRRPTRSLKRFRQAELSDADVDAIDAERRKRAKLIGIELSGDTE